MEGALEFTPTDPETGMIELSIKAASVSTGSREFDDILKSADFFAVAGNPRITFRSTGITKTGERTGDLKGELTILGVTRPVVLTTTWNFTGEHPLAASNPTYQGKWVSGFSATTKVLRSDSSLACAAGMKRACWLIASSRVLNEVTAIHNSGKLASSV